MHNLYPYSKGISDRSFYEKENMYEKMLSGLDDTFYKVYVDIMRSYSTKKSVILDAGCGIGTSTAQIARDRKVVGIDWSLRFLKEAKRRLPQVDFVQGNLCDMPIADDSIDFVGVYDVIEHIYDVEKFFMEIKRISRKNAKLFIIAPNNASPIMPLLNFYYSKKYRFKKGHRMFISMPRLAALEIKQLINFMKTLFNKDFVFKYRRFSHSLVEYSDDDTIFYTSYFIIKYLKNNGFKIFKKMAAPVVNIKYALAKIFPCFFTTLYVIAQKE